MGEDGKEVVGERWMVRKGHGGESVRRGRWEKGMEQTEK